MGRFEGGGAEGFKVRSHEHVGRALPRFHHACCVGCALRFLVHMPVWKVLSPKLSFFCTCMVAVGAPFDHLRFELCVRDLCD